MKTSTKLMLLALGAAGLGVVMTAPASAQTLKPRDQTCANPSTARDRVLKPDERCLRGGGKKETFQEQQANRVGDRVGSFVKANPPKTFTVGPKGGGGSSRGQKPR
jgi:hypothetical protein